MLLSERQIVWTPVLGRDSLAIALQRPFATACMAHKVDDIKKFTEGVWRLMGNKPPVEPSNFLDIHQGILPKGFYAGHDGLWLTMDSPTAHPTRPLYYHGHNEDRHASDRLWLLRAFAAWAEGAATVMNWD